jgi:predicted nucleic acid-binding protein
MRGDLVLIDTSLWIFALRKSPQPEILRRVDGLLGEDTVATMGIIKLELLGGVKTEAEFQRLRSRLDALHVIETSAGLWDQASVLAFQLRRQGVTVPYTDVLIATGALEVNALMLHADRHFDEMAGRSPLRVESYVERLARFS